MIEIRLDPSPREIRIFGGLCLLFFGAVGAVALWRPEGLVGAAWILGTAWLISLVFNSSDRLRQLGGALLPALFAVVGGSVLRGVDPSTVAEGLWGAGGLVAVVVWIAPAAGKKLYVGWMRAAQPIGWTISHLVLAAVYYLVLTPIGLLMRLFGRDPMQRRFDSSASSYWVKRPAESDPSRHFRQF